LRVEAKPKTLRARFARSFFYVAHRALRRDEPALAAAKSAPPKAADFDF
jgi:hypothetical protein